MALMKKSILLALTIVTCTMAAGPLITRAQEAAAPAAPAVAGAPAAPAGDQVKDTTLLELWIVGGWCMYPIFILSALGLGYGIYAYLASREDKMVQMQLVPGLQDAIQKLDLRAASAICTGTPGIMTNILNSGLVRVTPDHLDMNSVEQGIDAAATEENHTGLKAIIMVSVMATLAPMFGLLGTVDGMIRAFAKIGMGNMGDPEKLAGDIQEAMITTWYGLTVGIPLMYLYFYLKGRFNSNMARLARVMGNLTYQLKLSFERLARGELAAESMSLASMVPTGAAPTAPQAAAAEEQKK
jgi:biopolymer transport protein ExbB